MRKFAVLATILALVLAVTVTSPVTAEGKNCTRIQDGVLTYPPGHYLEDELLKVGFDAYGLNWQAHIFAGSYANVALGRWGYPTYEGDDDAYLEANPTIETNWYLMTYVWPYRNVWLMIKWNDAWLSNKDCDGDGILDGYYLGEDIRGSGAWQTNHQKGSYIGDDGKEHKWEYFEKVVAVPVDAAKVDGIWYTADGIEIGRGVWGPTARIQSVYNDPYGGYHGVEYLSPTSVGFGFYGP